MNLRKITIFLCSIFFLILTILVKLDLVQKFDDFMYNIITNNMNDFSTKIFKFITFWGSTLWVIILVILFLILFIIIKKKEKGFIVFITLIISTILNNVVKIIIRRDRPVVLALVTENTYSFPSGHTMASVSLYGILLYLIIKSNLNKKIKIIFGTFLSIIPILVGISRIYLGVHFASDVIGGILLSLVLLLILTYHIDKKESL